MDSLEESLRGGEAARGAVDRAEEDEEDEDTDGKAADIEMGDTAGSVHSPIAVPFGDVSAVKTAGPSCGNERKEGNKK